MGKWWTIDINCPHCRMTQKQIVSKNMEVYAKPQEVMCWNSEKQDGCKQLFTVTLEMHVKCMKSSLLSPEKKHLTLEPVYEDEPEQAQ
jgi:hypothetical protein